MLDLGLGQRDKKIEWLKARRNSIGSSDIAAILGVSPWRTALDVWREKTATGEPEITSNWAQARGIELEPEARDRYEEVVGRKYPPRSFTHQEAQNFTCSMDGFDEESYTGVEIKCPGAKDHALAKQGKVPEKYLPQIEWQYFVSNAKKIDYVSYFSNELVIVPVEPPSHERRMYLMLKAAEFWHYVQERKQPPITSRDTVEVLDPVAIELANHFADLHCQVKALTERLENTRATLISAHGVHDKVKIGPVNMTKLGDSWRVTVDV